MPFGGTSRPRTFLEDAETVEFSHKHLIRRPAVREIQSESSSIQPQASHVTTQSSNLQGEVALNPLSNPWAEKRRFELFIDLTWVGIIGNIADNFAEEAFSPDSDTSSGRAVANSIVLFLIAWRLWKYLQEFMTKYATNDLIERLFVLWVLILAMLYGNNAPYLLVTTDAQDNIAIIIFLLARGSILALESVYAIFLPTIRRSVLLRMGAVIPVWGLWIGAIFVQYPTKAGLVAISITLEVATGSLMSLPALERLLGLGREREKADDLDHWVERIRDFFIIILGEGVLNLIRGGPLGRGLNNHTWVGVLALGLYSMLSGLYFNGDQSRNYVHAVKRTWWRGELWLLSHVVMYHATLILGVSIIFIVEHPITNALTPKGDEAPTFGEVETERGLEQFMNSAKWSVAVSLSTVVTCQTLLALLSRSLDRPGTMKIDNRYIRLSARLIVVAVTMFLPLVRHMVGSVMLAILLALLTGCVLWEGIVCLDKNGTIIER